MASLSIELKIIFSIVIFTFVITGISRHQMSENILEQFVKSKKEKNDLLFETVAPIVSLNMSLGFDDANIDYLDLISKKNKDIEHMMLFDKDDKVIFSFPKHSQFHTVHGFKEMEESMTHLHRKIFDPITEQYIGYFDIRFSDDDYQSIISQNNDITFKIILFITLMTIVFVFLLKRQFQALRQLTNHVLEYNPKLNNFPLKKSKRLDEIGIIHDAIVSMVTKINTYASMLDQSNLILEKKVKQRTQELYETNKKLENLLEDFRSFTANAIHQIRTPVSVIKIAVEMIDTKSDEAVLQVKSSLLSIEHMYDTLAYTLNQNDMNFEKEQIDLSKLLTQRIEVFQVIALAHDTKIEYQIEPEVLVYFNKTEAEFLIDNNLSNALKYSISQKTIYVTMFKSSSTIVLMFDSLGEKIEDTDAIFKRYKRFDKTRKGTGLGLNIVDSICKKNKVLIELDYINGYNRFIYKFDESDIEKI